MSAIAPVPDPLPQLLTALKPWLGQVVVVGGWAHQLYRLHPHAQRLDYPPLTTRDADVAVPPRLPPHAQDIRQRLLAQGFAEEFWGDERPPATHYHLGNEADGFYAEFVSPLLGSDVDRKGRRKTTAEIAGIASQRLRYVEILLQDPWSIHFASKRFAGTVQIANPVSFIAQKVLIHARRERPNRAKDILYMRDTFEVFGERLGELRDLYRTKVRAQLGSRRARLVSAAATTLFANVSDDLRRAAAISQERRLTPEAIRRACELGFLEVFG